MLQSKWAITIYLVTSLLSTPITTEAATYYVATTGNDSNSCAQAQNAATPKLTIPAGVKCLAGGDALIIKAGTYANQEITNPPAGTPTQYTVIHGDTRGMRPIIAPNGAEQQRGFYCNNGAACRYIELRYLEVTGAYQSAKLYGNNTVGFPHHIRFIDNIFHDSNGLAILTATSATGFQGGDHLFRGNEFYRTGVGNPGYGPGHNTIYNPGNRSIVEHNTFHNLANGVGIWTTGISLHNVIVRANVFYDIGRSSTDSWQQGNRSFSAVHVSVPGGGHQIYNNLIYRSGDERRFTGIRVWKALADDVTHIYNNTIYDIKHPNAAAILIVPEAGTHLVKNNIAYLAGAGIIGGTQSHNLTDDPRFKAPEKANFSLHRMSPAIDTGVEVPITTDFAGVLRPQGIGYDVGAYEASNARDPQTPKQLSIE